MGERRTAVVIGSVIVVTLALLALWTMSPGESHSVPAVLTEVTEPAALSEILELSHIGIATSTNYVGHRIYLVRGTVRNIAETPVRLVMVRMAFVDEEGGTVEEGVYEAFDLKQKPLEPGTEYRFEIAFENLPRNWNYRIPNTEIVKAAY